mgnify:CR=1 FL=1
MTALPNALRPPAMETLVSLAVLLLLGSGTLVRRAPLVSPVVVQGKPLDVLLLVTVLPVPLLLLTVVTHVSLAVLAGPVSKPPVVVRLPASTGVARGGRNPRKARLRVSAPCLGGALLRPLNVIAGLSGARCRLCPLRAARGDQSAVLWGAFFWRGRHA